MCFRRGWTVHGVIDVGGWTVHGAIGVDGQCMVLSAWMDSAWCFERGWTVHGIIGECGQLVVHVL